MAKVAIACALEVSDNETPRLPVWRAEDASARRDTG